MSDWREHVAGPVIGEALFCSRCLVVLWIDPGGCKHPSKSPWPDGCRVASDGTHVLGDISGWPYTPCKKREMQVGDSLVHASP